MRKHLSLLLFTENINSDNIEFCMFNYGRFQRKNETKIRIGGIFISKLGINIFSERTFMNIGRMELLKATG